LGDRFTISSTTFADDIGVRFQQDHPGSFPVCGQAGSDDHDV
jgi:hypothetical protein